MATAKRPKTGEKAAAQAKTGRPSRPASAPTSNVVRLQQPAELMATKLAESGLDAKAARAMRVRLLTRAEAQQVLGVPAYGFGAAMLLPYLDAAGQDTGFFRVRGLGPVPPGAFGEVKDPPKYLQRAGSLNRAYLAPTLGRSWAEVVSDPTVDIIITEGELKAAKACAEGFTTVGLGGVDAWSSKARGHTLLPDLAEWEWNQRPVTILYDADVARKAEVQAAQDRLARELTGRGALVALAFLPPDGPKGLDDFLVERGAEALRDVLAAALPHEPGLALRAMNVRLAYVEEPGVVAVRRTGQLVRPDDAKAHRFSNERHHVNRGDSVREVSTFDEWIKWKCRLQCARLVYEPGKEEFVGEDYNTWRPSGCEPKEGDIRPWHALLDHLFAGADPAHRRWFERWLAYPLQVPGTKLYSAVMLWSHAQGVGKDLVAESLERLYGANFQKVDEGILTSDFTGWLYQRQFVYGEEITGNDSRAHANKLKGLITSSTVEINQKYLKTFTVRNTVNFLFSSNHSDALRLEHGDRRYFIHEVTAPRMAQAEGDRIGAWKDSPEGPAALLHYLLHLDLGDFNPKAPPPVTAAKEAMAYEGSSDLGQWVMELVADPVGALSSFPMFKGRVALECDLFTTKQLLQVFENARPGKPVTLRAMGATLKEHGLRLCGGPSGVVRVGGHSAKLYAVRNRERWMAATGKECGDHFTKFYGDSGEVLHSPRRTKY